MERDPFTNSAFKQQSKTDKLFIFPVSKVCLDKKKKKTNQIDFLNLLWGIQIKSKRGQIAAK